jgi:hypothetical protein
MEQQTNIKGQQGSKQPAPRRARLRLPFENRKQDPVDWIYEKRFGLCITLVVALSLSVVFVWAQVGSSVETEKEEEPMFYLDLSDVPIEEVKQPSEPQEQQPTMTKGDWRQVQNLASNENADEGEALRKDKFSDDPEIKRLQEAVAQSTEANKKTYDKGLREVEAILQDNQTTENKDKDIGEKNVKRKGTVVVSFSFTNPVRYAKHLIKPAYRCEGGGEVVVTVVVNQSGKVVSATVVSGGDDCMRVVAREAALGSSFDINSNAPAKQSGTITYIFVPQ